MRIDNLLVGLDVDSSLGPLAGGDLAVEQNIDFAVRTVLHLRQVEVCEDKADETGTSPNITALATKIGLLFHSLVIVRYKHQFWGNLTSGLSM